MIKSSKTNHKPNPPFKSIKTHNTNWKLKKSISKNKNINQYSDTPKVQDDDVVDWIARVTNTDADHQDMVANPSQNFQNKMYFSDDSVRVTDDSGGQVSPKVTLDKQTPDKVKRGVLSQALLASIRSRRSAIGSIDSGSDMNPDVVNVIDDTLTREAMAVSTVADVGMLGSGNSNWSF